MSRTPLSKVVLQNFGFPGHRRQASIPEVHRDGRKLLLAVGVIFIGVEDGADRRDETGLNRLNVFCQMLAIAAQFDAEQKQLKAKQARLEHELAMTKDKLGKLRVNQSITDYNLGEMRKQMAASAGASVELEFESRSSHFQMKATHPDTARALKEFAGQIIDGQRNGTLWLPGRADNA
jgi:hypothetical protein